MLASVPSRTDDSNFLPPVEELLCISSTSEGGKQFDVIAVAFSLVLTFVSCMLSVCRAMSAYI